MKGNNVKPSLLLASSTLLLVSACSDNEQVSVPIEPPVLNSPQVFAGSLTQTGQVSAATFIRNGLYSASLGHAGTPKVEALTANALNNASFSTTNTQESGVDEADRIEFDGAHFFVAEYPIWQEQEQEYQAHVRVLAQNEDNQLSLIDELTIENSDWGIHGIYLAPEDSQLAVLSGSQPVFAVGALTTAAEMQGEYSPSFNVEIFNVSAPDDITAPDKLTFDGRLLNSRRIDQYLYVVSSFVPRPEGLVFGASTSSERLQNYQHIQSLADESLVPNIKLNEVSLNTLQVEDCLVPELATSLDGSAQIVHVARIDLTQPANVESLCISALTSDLYASTEALYLVGEGEKNTYLHKVSMAEGVNYAASGSVPGVVWGSAQPHLRLSEYEGVMRIVTTDYWSEPQDPLHQLFTLEERGSQLEIIGQLPNEAYPEAIGKPGEDVFAVRYIGNKGYVVTFERIDPLYVIDLTDPAFPELQGELEIPGFSSYLQPIGDSFLLGVGQEIDIARLPNNGQVGIQPIILNELKISLFDVRDPANPLELDTLIREESFTPVEYDYRSLAVFQQNSRVSFAMPYETWQMELSGASTQTNKLLSFAIDTNAVQPSLIDEREIEVTASADHYIYAGEDRSVITNSGVYYLRGNQLYFQAHATDAPLLGPF